MRRILLILLCAVIFISAVLLILTQCNENGGMPSPSASSQILKKLSGNFKTTARVTYRGLAATAEITQDSPESCTVAFLAPDTLNGMSVRFSSEDVEVSYKGLGFSFNPTSLPGASVAKTAVSAINTALRDEGLRLEQLEGTLSVMGTSDSGEFTLLLEPDSGNLLKLSVPRQELEIEFENFTFLE